MQSILRSRGVAGNVLRRLGTAVRPRLVLGIESSFDDTSVAIVDSDRQILAAHEQSQDEVHKPFGGVQPKLAAQVHAHTLPLVLRRVMSEAGVTMADIGAIAVTRGPGLAPCLAVGLNMGKGIASVLGKPLYGVHHMEAHALTGRLEFPEVQFPFLALLVSGGHTLLVVVRGVGQSTILGTTLDDAAGEALDKGARMLGISPGDSSLAASLERIAVNGRIDAHKFPSPMKMHASMNFSFAGLKTHLRYAIEGRTLTEQQVADYAAGYQNAVVEHIFQNVRRALRHCEAQGIHMKHLVISGGVARNTRVRDRVRQLADEFSLATVAPSPHLCVDNAAMIAWAAHERILAGDVYGDSYSTEVISTWPIDRAPKALTAADIEMERKTVVAGSLFEMRRNWTLGN